VSDDAVALRADDLAPGDRRCADADRRDLTVRRVRDAADPDFAYAYARLRDAFDARGELEPRAVLAARLAWEPATTARCYELLVVRQGDVPVAVRDHTAIVVRDAVVVHCSHALIEPAARGRGLAGWLRALPLGAARRLVAAVGLPPATPVVLVAEMEPPDPADPMSVRRLRSYARAGFRTVTDAPYRQPDLRGGAGAPAVPLQLLVRRVGREAEPTMPATEVRAVVDALYGIYAAHVPDAALAPLRAAAAAWTAGRAAFALVVPAA
jgi:hypothetical protein